MKRCCQRNHYQITTWLVLGLCVGSVLAEPFIPITDSEVLERLPASRNPQVRQLQNARQALAATPGDLSLAVDLATRFLRLGRAEADPRYYGYAQAALRPWWNSEQPPTDVLVLRAVIRQSRHDFDGALADLIRVNTLRPGNAQAWLSRSVIHRVRGNYPDAIASCRPLFQLVKRLLATACESSAAALSGQAESSYALLQAELLRAPTSDADTRLWVLTLLAEMAIGLGRGDEAEHHLRAGMALGRRSTTLLAAYADLLLDHGRTQEVIDLLGPETNVDGLLLRLAIAARRSGSPALDEYIRSLQARFAATRARGDPPHLRSEARFALHVLGHPAEALTLADANWQVQKEPWDARLVLEAALGAGQFDAATAVIQRLASDRTEHAQLRRLAGQIETAR